MPMLNGMMVSDRWISILGMKMDPSEARSAWCEALERTDPEEVMKEIRQCIIDALSSLEQTGYDGAISIALTAYEDALAKELAKL